METMYNCIDKCAYLKICQKTNTVKVDPNSFCSIIDVQLSQSQKIKTGKLMEELLSDYILSFGLVQNIRPKNTKGFSEYDHLFSKDNVIYYAELKANLNLDTEKSKATVNKCIHNVSRLEQAFPGKTIKWGLVSLRSLKTEDILPYTRSKYTKIANNLLGLQDYLGMLDINTDFLDNKSYKEFVNYAVKKSFLFIN